MNKNIINYNYFVESQSLHLIMSITCSPALPMKIYVEFHIKSVVCISSPLPKIGIKFRTKFVVRILLQSGIIFTV